MTHRAHCSRTVIAAVGGITVEQFDGHLHIQNRIHNGKEEMQHDCCRKSHENAVNKVLYRETVGKQIHENGKRQQIEYRYNSL